MPEHHGCAARSRERGEPLLGTASTVRRWILVEQPGAWGHDALLESDLPVEVGRQVRAAGHRLGARPVLVRRPGVRAPAQPRGREAFLVTADPTAPVVRRVTFTHPEELVEVVGVAGERGFAAVGDEGPDRLVLVCTHGRHDTCCAVEGRPVAAALASVLGEVWECSHVGGDRFAANVVVLPEGIYHGRIGVGDVAAFARDLDADQLDLDHVRGRSQHPFPVQAAEILLRRQLGLRGLEDVRVVDHAGASEANVRVRLQAGAQAWDVEVAVDHDPEGHRLTCRAHRANHPPRYRLVRAAPCRG